MGAPLLVLDPYLTNSPAHRRHALDSRGGPSLAAQLNLPNATTRPQAFGFTANMPFVRDPNHTQSGWGLGLGAFLSAPHSSPSLKSYKSQTFEISVGRSTFVPSLAESVGLQGFFEVGFNMSSLDFDKDVDPSNGAVPSPRRSFLLRFGAMSLSEGRGIVTYKPYRVDQSVVSSLLFPFDMGETVISVAHTAQIGCGWNLLKCGTALNYTRFSQTIRIAGFDEPSQWLSYGVSLSLYAFGRGTIVRTRVLWDSVKTSSGEWVNGRGIPTINGDLAFVF